MDASAAPTRATAAPAEARGRDQRSTGTIRIRLAERAGRSQVTEAYQHGAARVRFPLVPAGVEAMILNTAGGLAAGDQFAVTAAVDAQVLTLSTQACERVYRADHGHGPATVVQRYSVARGATLRALPQPTILFDNAALDRNTVVDVADGARLTLVEGLVFGRAAMGEAVTRAMVRDRLEIRIAGQLSFVDALRLTPHTFSGAENPAGLAGARATAIALHVGPEPAHAVAAMREAGQGEGVRVGASAVNGVATARLLAASHDALQWALARIVQAVDGAAVPRTWAL